MTFTKIFLTAVLLPGVFRVGLCGEPSSGTGRSSTDFFCPGTIPHAPAYGGTPMSLLALGDTLFTFDVENVATPAVNAQLGVEYAMGYFWVTGGSTSGGTKNLYQFNKAGKLVATYPQGTTSNYGWRDLAFDGRYLYAGDENEFARIDPYLGTKVGTLPKPAGATLMRGLAFDDATRHFWTKDFFAPLIEFDSTGTVFRAFNDTLAGYGLAWDKWSPGGPYLWIWSQDGPENGPYCLASQFNPRTGQLTGLQFLGRNFRADSLTDIAGGATITTDLDTSKIVMVTLQQSSPDRVVCYILGNKSNPAGVHGQPATGHPETIRLADNYPNPFNPSTTVRAHVGVRAYVTMAVYDVIGREVCTLYEGNVNPGELRTIWNGRDNAGREVPGGVYVAHLRTASGPSSSIKMLLLK